MSKVYRGGRQRIVLRDVNNYLRGERLRKAVWRARAKGSCGRLGRLYAALLYDVS